MLDISNKNINQLKDNQMKRLFLMLLAALTLVACDKGGDDSPPKSITVPNQQQLTQTVYADDNVGKSGVTFTTKGAWTSEISESATAKSTRAVADWVSISPSSGDKAGDYTIQISLLTNYTGEKRSATISLKCSGEMVSIVVAQEAVTAAGDKPEPDPEPSGEGLLTNETTGESVKLTEVQYEISSPNSVRVRFVGGTNGYNGYLMDFYNPLQNGKLKPHTYNVKMFNVRPRPEAFDGDCEWHKSGNSGYGTSGTIKVELNNDTYTFTFDLYTEESDKENYHFTGSFTGIPKYLNKEIKVESITLSEPQKTLEFGGSFTLNATILPEDATDKRINWSSSNTAIATVDENGVVKATSAGKATITATSNEGGKTATCEVTVAPAVAVQSIKVAPTEVSLLKGEFYNDLVVTVLPENAHNKNYTWKSSNAAIADYNGKAIEAKSAGVATITFTTEDQSKTATFKVTVTERQGQGSGNVKVVDPSGKYDEMNYPLIEGIHTITAKNKVELSLKDDKGNGVVQLRFTNPLSNGHLAAGNYTISRTESANNNSVINYSMYSDFGYYESGTVVVSVSGDTYTIAMTDIPTSNGRKITCSYTGKLTYANEYAEVSSVTLDKTTLSLDLGKSAQLTATVNPSNAFNKNVTWSSSNTNIAQVDRNGSVWASGVGIATITVTTEDGAKIATCQVSVNALPSTGTGTFSNNHSQSITIDRALQSMGKDPKEINITLRKLNSASGDLAFTLVRGDGDTGALKAGTYTSISYLGCDDLGIKYSYVNTGSVIVALNGENYTVTLDITTSEGIKITGTYTGKIPVAQ